MRITSGLNGDSFKAFLKQGETLEVGQVINVFGADYTVVQVERMSSAGECIIRVSPVI
jgi:phosphotransferase system IIA component